MSTPVAVFPAAVATDAQLKVANNLITTSLRVAIDASNTILFVNSTAGFPANCLVSIDKEIIAIQTIQTSPNPALIVISGGRGFDGTAAAAHSAGAKVALYIDAWHHNALAAEVKAIESALGPNLGNVTTMASGALDASKYNFTPQSPGGSLIAGSNVITLSPVPAGVNATNTNHWLYIGGGTGTAEAVQITGGSAVAGAASGTVIVTCTYAHSGAWTIATATGGITEAIWSLPANGGTINVPMGSYAIHAPIKRRVNSTIWIRGAGQSTVTLAIASDFPLSANGVFDWSPGDGPTIPEGGASNLTIKFIQPDSTDPTVMTHWPAAIYTTGTYQTVWDSIVIIAAWRGISSPAATNGAKFSHIFCSHFERFIYLEWAFDSYLLNDVHSGVYGLTSNQTTAYLNSTTSIGLMACGVADLKVSDSIFGNLHCISLLKGSISNSTPKASFTNTWCEGQIAMSDGVVRFNGLHTAYGGTSSGPIISHSGGILQIDNAWILYTGDGSGIVSSVAHGDSDTQTGPLFCLSNSYYSAGANSLISLFGSSSYAGRHTIELSDVLIYRPVSTIANAYIDIDNGTGDVRLFAKGLSFTSAPGPVGSAIVLANDNYHVISGCDGGGFGYSLGGATKIVWEGNTNFAGNVNSFPDAMRVRGKLSPSIFVPLQCENYIASETGAANAIAGSLTDANGTNVPVAAGLRVTVKLAHTLQAGANTFVLNGGAAVAIKSAKNSANNIATAYAATGVITMLYDGTQWLDLSQ